MVRGASGQLYDESQVIHDYFGPGIDIAWDSDGNTDLIVERGIAAPLTQAQIEQQTMDATRPNVPDVNAVTGAQYSGKTGTPFDNVIIGRYTWEGMPNDYGSGGWTFYFSRSDAQDYYHDLLTYQGSLPGLTIGNAILGFGAMVGAGSLLIAEAAAAAPEAGALATSSALDVSAAAPAELLPADTTIAETGLLEPTAEAQAAAESAIASEAPTAIPASVPAVPAASAANLLTPSALLTAAQKAASIISKGQSPQPPPPLQHPGLVNTPGTAQTDGGGGVLAMLAAVFLLLR